MATRDDLEALSSAELHDRATKRALKHLDVKFFWELEKMLPAAEASVGDVAEADNDIQSIYGRINNLHDTSEGAIADALRPVYIDYLLKHSG